MSTTQRSHSAITPSRDIVTPVPHCIVMRPGAARMSATSSSRSEMSTSAAVAARSSVNARERGAQRFELRGIAVLAKLAFVGTLREQRVRQRAENGNVGAGPDGNVHVGEGRGLGAAGVEHPHATAGARGIRGGSASDPGARCRSRATRPGWCRRRSRGRERCGFHTGFSIGSPLTNSAATSTGALSTVTAVRKERLPIDGSHVLAAICPAASYARPVARYSATASGPRSPMIALSRSARSASSSSQVVSSPWSRGRSRRSVA